MEMATVGSLARDELINYYKTNAWHAIQAMQNLSYGVVLLLETLDESWTCACSKSIGFIGSTLWEET